MIKIPTKSEYKKHLKKYAQYAKSADWVRWCSEVAGYRAMRTVTLLEDYKPKSAKILDLGCGIGLTMSILAQEYKNCVGCDVNRHSILATKSLLGKVGLKNKVVMYDGKKLPFLANSFDVVTSLEVIEHADDPKTMLSEIARVLKKDGILIITTANKWWPYEPHFKLLFLSYLPTKLADIYVRVSGKGESYESIKLPGYSQFRKTIERNFWPTDITLKIIREYDRFSLDRERGFKVVLVGKVLQLFDFLKKTRLAFLSRFADWILVRVSLGWVFLGRPKK